MRLTPRSLRGRLVVLFALGTIAAVGISSVAIYATLNAQIDHAVNSGLAARADDIAGTLDPTKPQIREDDGFALVLTPDGQVVTASATITEPAKVLTVDEFRQATLGPISVDRGVTGLGQHARLLAQPEDIGASRVVVVTGTALDTEVAARQRLVQSLALIDPLLVVVLAMGAWLVTGAALRPVRRISNEADEISRVDLGRRLPEPITEELAQLARTLNAMLDRLAAAFARERGFVDDASHELRTPIAILRGELELAVDSDDPVELHRTILSALEETEHLAELADDLLVLARAGAAGLPLRPEAVDLNAATREIAERVDPVDYRAIAITITGDATVWADPFRVAQIITNLVANARRYARSRIAIEIVDHGDHALLQIADDGAGFPIDFLATAFDRFAQADPSRQRQDRGAGLGLAIVAALAEAHHGHAEARNGPPLGGAVVEVTLPAAPSDDRSTESER